MVFLTLKTLLSSLDRRTFLSTVNIMIMQRIRKKCVRFGGYVDIEVIYKILWLQILEKALILLNLLCFLQEQFGSLLNKYTCRTVGINTYTNNFSIRKLYQYLQQNHAYKYYVTIASLIKANNINIILRTYSSSTRLIKHQSIS